MEQIYNSVDLQQLTIKILSLLSKNEMEKILDKVSEQENDNEEVTDQLNLCMLAAGEFQKNPHCYDTLGDVCIAILKRQKHKKANLKKSYQTALGITYNLKLIRIENGEEYLEKEQVENICSNFEDKNNKRFWQNQLFALHPSISVFSEENNIEYQCVKAVYNALTKEQVEKISNVILKETENEKENAICYSNNCGFCIICSKCNGCRTQSWHC